MPKKRRVFRPIRHCLRPAAAGIPPGACLRGTKSTLRLRHLYAVQQQFFDWAPIYQIILFDKRLYNFDYLIFRDMKCVML